MDIKKLQDIIDNSNLTDEAKNLILDLMPEANRPEIQEEILKTIDYEIEMYGLAADEFDEVLDQIHVAEKKIDAADKLEDEQLEELKGKYEEKMGSAEANIKQQLQYKDNLVKALAEEPKAEVAPVAPVTQVEDITPQAAAPVAPMATTPVQNMGYGGQQYNAVPTTQPAAFPTTPVMGGQG